jgi:hypothetical protein
LRAVNFSARKSPLLPWVLHIHGAATLLALTRYGLHCLPDEEWRAIAS